MYFAYDDMKRRHGVFEGYHSFSSLFVVNYFLRQKLLMYTYMIDALKYSEWRLIEPAAYRDHILKLIRIFAKLIATSSRLLEPKAEMGKGPVGRWG